MSSEPFDDFSAPEPVKKPRSRLAAAAGRLYYRIKAALYQNKEQADVLELIDRLDTVIERLRSIEIILAVTRAERDSANARAENLALVVTRDRERVEAEIAMHSAKREMNKNAARDERKLRNTGDD